MAPPSPSTHGKKGGRGVKLTSSFSSARLEGDGNLTRSRLPKSISVADICHPHVSQYTSFEPIDEAAGADLGGDPAGDTRDHRARRKKSLESTSLGSEAPAVRDYAPAKMAGHDAAAGSHPNTPPQALPYSKTSDLEFLSPRPAPLPRSTTTVFPPVRLQNASQHFPSAAYYDPDEVNRKVAAMLAATEALKPKSPDQSTMKQSMKRRVLSKIAGFFGRRRSNRSGKANRKCVKDTESEMDRSTTFLQVSSTRPLRTLGENTESRTRTPQGPVERRIPRKPVPKDELHLETSCVAMGGPVSTSEAMGEETLGPYGIEKETKVDNLPKGREGKEANDYRGSRTRIGDPFGSEQSFDNLEGFLTTQPVGSSTPKKRGSYDRNWIAANSSNDRFSPSRPLSHHSANDADDELTNEDSEASISEKDQGKRPAKSSSRLRRSSTNVLLDVDTVEPQRVKIHPSPSKASLEELSKQFEALLPSPNSQRESAMNRMGLSSIMTAFPRPPARIPASQTSILSTAGYHASRRAHPQASSVPLSSTEQQLFTTDPPARSPSRRAWQAGDVRHVPRKFAGGGPGVHISQFRTSQMDELQLDDGTYGYSLYGAQIRPV